MHAIKHGIANFFGASSSLILNASIKLRLQARKQNIQQLFKKRPYKTG